MRQVPVKKGAAMSSDPDAPPFNPLPWAVVALALPIFVIEVIFYAASKGFLGGPAGVGWRLSAIENYSFVPALFDYMASSGRWSAENLLRFVIYPFLHFGFTHVLMVLVFLLALGKLVGEVFGSRAVLVIFFGSAVFGALILTLLTDSQQPLVGGYPAVYGLVGGYTFILRSRLAAEGGPQNQAFILIGFLLFIQLVFGMIYGSGPDWIAEVAGFVAGFGLSVVLSPGGWDQTLIRLRRR